MSYLAVLALVVFADASPMKTESQQNRTPTPAFLQSPASKQGLNFVVGDRGLDFTLVQWTIASRFARKRRVAAVEIRFPRRA